MKKQFRKQAIFFMVFSMLLVLVGIGIIVYVLFIR